MLNAGANLLLATGARSAVWEQDRTLVVLNYAALSVGVVIALWGTARIVHRLDSLETTTSKLFDAEWNAQFRELNSVLGPLLAAAATAAAFGTSGVIRDGWTAGILRGTTWFVLATALWTYLWTYGSLQLGLSRLGRARLRADAALAGPGLGLLPLGKLASTGLWMLLIWLVPVLLTGLPDIAGVVIGAAVLAAALAAFFLSLLHLHRRMAQVKERELAVARDLYAQAYEPVRTAQTLQALDRQHRLLGAADALEKRASAIHEWPVDEGTVARVLTITTSVIAMTVARVILDPFGL